MSEIKAPVSERALIARINRKLKIDGQTLKKLRGDRWLNDLGRYYIVENNHVVQGDINLEEFGRELEVLRPWEKLTEGED